MSKVYKAATAVMETFVRANQITISNPLPTSGGVPSIQFQEMLVGEDTTTGEMKEIEKEGYCSEALTADNISESFDLIHPVTGDVIGQSTYQDLQVLLFSIYFHVAEKRDIVQAEQEALLALDQQINWYTASVMSGENHELFTDESVSSSELALELGITEAAVNNLRQLIADSTALAEELAEVSEGLVEASEEEQAASAEATATAVAEANAEEAAAQAALDAEMEAAASGE